LRKGHGIANAVRAARIFLAKPIFAAGISKLAGGAGVRQRAREPTPAQYDSWIYRTSRGLFGGKGKIRAARESKR
jgi:hypothetical protein